MANSIVLTASPQGRFLEGVVSGTPLPGIAMQVKPNTAPVGGRYTWEPFNQGADGDRYLVAILLEAYWVGRTSTDAYKDGEYCRLYCPIPGDELLVLVADVGGTADSYAIGDKLIIANGTGKMKALSGTPQSVPFVVMEPVPALTGDKLVHVMYTGY